MEGRPRDRDLVERAQRGDEAAYEELVQTYATIGFRTAYLLTRHAEDAEDAAQDGFVKAWRALGRFRPGEPFAPWLLRIVANEAKNRRRSAGRRARLALRAENEFSGGAAPPPESTVVAAEQRTRLLEAVERLPEEQRDVVVCRYLLDLSERETAEDRANIDAAGSGVLLRAGLVLGFDRWGR